MIRKETPLLVAGRALRRLAMRRTQQRITDLGMRRIPCAPYSCAEAAVTVEERIYDTISWVR